MPISSFALIIGVVAYACGFPLIFGDKDAVSWRKKILRDESTLRFIGITFSVLAVLTLKKQWNFTPDPDGLVILIAWASLAKGLLMAWWPDQFVALKGSWNDRMLSTPLMQTITGLLMVIVGAFFTYLGLVMM